MPQITYDNEIFEYEVIKSKRKTISIQITHEGKVKVSSPIGVGDKYIKDLVYKKANWIISKLKVAKEVHNSIEEKEYVTGDLIQYLGKDYRLKVFEDEKLKAVKIELYENILEVRINPNIIKGNRSIIIRDVIEEWLKHRARVIFEERTRYYCEKLGLKYNMIRIKEQKTLWGSCSSKANLNFNWRLIMAPQVILNYVVIHEVCHLKHRDHSRRFWGLVEYVMPDYLEKRRWLKENGRRLVL